MVPVPKSIFDKLRSLIFSFLWGSTADRKKFHLTDWLASSKPTSLGGWGIKHLGWFNISLCLKSFWLALNGNGIWFKVLSVKYLKKLSVVSWIRNKAFSVRGVSVIWKGFIHTLSWLGRGLTWHVGNGETIRVGLDPIVGMGSPYSLRNDLREYLEEYGILTLDQARNYSPDARYYRLSAEDLDLGGDWKLFWNNYISGLEYGKIRLNSQVESLLWSYKNYAGNLTAAFAYDCISQHLHDLSSDLSIVLNLLWKINIPAKIRCFIWLLIMNKVLTWENLNCRGYQGPSICFLCRMGEDLIQHLVYRLLIYQESFCSAS